MKDKGKSEDNKPTHTHKYNRCNYTSYVEVYWSKEETKFMEEWTSRIRALKDKLNSSPKEP